jgi:hypothetical protein
MCVASNAIRVRVVSYKGFVSGCRSGVHCVHNLVLFCVVGTSSLTHCDQQTNSAYQPSTSLRVVSGAAAGVLGGLFGAGAPPALLLFAFFAARPDLQLSPAVLRSSGVARYSYIHV